MDNCLSIFKNHFGDGQYYSYDMEALGQYYNLYTDLMNHWETVLPGFVYHSQYENLITDQESETRKLLEFCGLPWDENCLSFHETKRKVKTASNAQVRQPIYKDSVMLSKRYGDKLKPLEDAIYGSWGTFKFVAKNRLPSVLYLALSYLFHTVLNTGYV